MRDGQPANDGSPLHCRPFATQGERWIWIDAGRQRFGSFAELNARLGARCRALWSELRHPVHGRFSLAEMLELELPHLMRRCRRWPASDGSRAG